MSPGAGASLYSPGDRAYVVVVVPPPGGGGIAPHVEGGVTAVLPERRHRQDEAGRYVEILRPEAEPYLPPPSPPPAIATTPAAFPLA